MLEKHNAAWCWWDLAGVQSPVLPTANFTYVRLHGPGDRYQGSYSGEWARRIPEWESSLEAVFLYFDNDTAGFGVANALRINAMLA